MTTAELDRLAYRIIQGAIEIHKALGPGLLESAYRTCMIHELRARNIGVRFRARCARALQRTGVGWRIPLDLLVEDAVVIELKALEVVLPVHRAQVLSSLRLLDKRLGLLINFNVERLVVGVDRIVNNFGRPGTASIAPAGEASRSPENNSQKHESANQIDSCFRLLFSRRRRWRAIEGTTVQLCGSAALRRKFRFSGSEMAVRMWTNMTEFLRA